MEKIEGYPNLYKKDGAVVNTDYSAFLRAKERKKEKQAVKSMEERLNNIEQLLERLLKHVDIS